MDKGQYLTYFGKVHEGCVFENADRQERLWRKVGLNTDFWKEVENKLRLSDLTYKDFGEPCFRKSRVFISDLWLPTSDQLKGVLGLSFTGTVCADKVDKCKTRMNQTWDPGMRVVIGNELYITSN